MGFFGQHDQYPFELAPETGGCTDEDGHEHVAKKMVNAGFGGRALEVLAIVQGERGERDR